MSIQYRRLAFEHLLYFKPQISQSIERDELLAYHNKYIIEQNTGLSAWVNDRCIGAAGLLSASHRAVAWALLSEQAGSFMLPLTRQINYVISTYPAKRFEMVVLHDFEPAHRWARMLGFKCETPDGMPNYFSNGAAGSLYAKVKA